VFFRVFRDGDREYLSRAWFRNPAEVTAGLCEDPEPASSLRLAANDPETADYLVRVNWLKTVDPTEAIHEKGFFGNQNSVARPRAPKWEYTVGRLKKRFGVK